MAYLSCPRLLDYDLATHRLCARQFFSSLNTITRKETTKDSRTRSSGLSLRSFQLKVQCTVVKGSVAF